MSYKHTKEVNVQIIISLLKSHGIRYIIGSPGTTNVAFLASVQNDPYFNVYSSVDERSAAYMACGLAAESGEPVVLSCTGATASRNYVSGLTEAYYRKLPILAITSTQPISRVGHNIAQVIDRSTLQNDIVKISVTLPIVKDDEDIWECEVKVNDAILELTRHGGGPAHINLPTSYTLPFVRSAIPKYRKIERISYSGSFPELYGKVAISIGSHREFSDTETKTIEDFCEQNNSVVFCDHTSGYKGKYKLNFSLLGSQEFMDKSSYRPDVLIQLGEISGDYHTLSLGCAEVWRVNIDGKLKDSLKRLRYVFEMDSTLFFGNYISSNKIKKIDYYEYCKSGIDNIRHMLPELPFSNIWVASRLSKMIPKKSTLHFGILNSLRSWNFFDLDETIKTASNVGGFGIDGNLSSIIGASLYESNNLYFCIVGDLAFFYDMNALGNKHVGNNLRILLVNNGKGTEFRNYNHHASYFGEEADELIAASEHYGNKSTTLVKNYAKSLGYDYISASNKDEFESEYMKFLSEENKLNPIIFEIFTDSQLESDALQSMQSIIKDRKVIAKKKARDMLGEKGLSMLKKLSRT
ncbi:hypothetical protein KW458_04855 [Vibrio fluvialis]|nr:hypothetical protein [Vibrio fluvialis]